MSWVVRRPTPATTYAGWNTPGSSCSSNGSRSAAGKHGATGTCPPAFPGLRRDTLPARSGGLRETELEFASLLALALTRRYAQLDLGPKTDVDAELWVDPELWSSVVEQVNDVSARLHAAAVAPRTPGTARVSMTASLFTMRAPPERR